MANALQDQLKKVGLTDDKQIKKVTGEQRKKRKRQRHGGPPVSDEAAETRRRIEQASAERAARERQLNLERSAQARRKAIEAQIRQLIESNRQSRDDGDLTYHFTVGTAVKTLYVPRKMHAQITDGVLGIVALGEEYEVVPRRVAEKIAAISPERVVMASGDIEIGEDDEYANYEVPDDLMW